MKTGTINDNRQILSSLFRNAFFVICLLELINSAAYLTDSYFIGNYIGSLGIAGFFISDSEEALTMAARSIRCVGFMIPFSTFNGMFIAFQQIMQRYRLVNLLSFLNRLFLIVAVSALFGFLFGTDGLWLALPVSEMLNALVSLPVVKRLTGRFPRSAYDLMCLPEDFGYSTGDYIEVSISGTEDIFALQDAVKEFCDNHGTDAKRSFYAQLALEELAMNVIRHGFPKCRRAPEIHVWILYSSGDINMRFQDNCPGFNVMKFCSELQQQSPEHCVGLRLVSRIAKDMSYVNSLGTNNLTITI